MGTYAKFSMSGAGARRILEGLPTAGPGWHRNLDESERISMTLRKEHFSVQGAGESYPAILIGFTCEDRDSNQFVVHNVVPVENGQLTVGQYNQALLDFYDAHIREHEGEPDLTTAPPRGQLDLSEYMDEEGFRLLQSFSAAANKSSVASHPLDFRRWAEFVSHCHRRQIEVPVTLLEAALVEEMDWDEESARDLVGEYERFRDLLNVYDPEPSRE